MDRVGEKQLYPPKDPLFPLNKRKGSLAVVGREEGLGDEWQTPTPSLSVPPSEEEVHVFPQQPYHIGCWHCGQGVPLINKHAETPGLRGCVGPALTILAAGHLGSPSAYSRVAVPKHALDIHFPHGCMH